MTKNKPIYHVRKPMKGLGETSPFHRFTNPRRDKSVYFWSRDSYLLYMWNMARIGFMASEKMPFENVDDGRTTDVCLCYKLTYEPSAQVS